jgi:hypothetical protein
MNGKTSFNPLYRKHVPSTHVPVASDISKTYL